MTDEKNLKPEDINPFRNDDMEWVDQLAQDWSEPRSPERTFTVKVASGTSPKDKEVRAVTTRLADIAPQPISWLWPGRVALGKLTLIAGDPGLGKSLLTATMAATVSKGYIWPLTNTASPIGSVVLLSAEDDPADTIRPRLDAAEADCTRIHVLQAIRDTDSAGLPIERAFSLKRDIAALEELLLSLPDCHLIVIDPISAYLEGADSHNNTDVRGLLAPLAKLASGHNVAIVLVQHLNKSSGGSAMYRAMGSVAFVAAARAAYIVTKDQNDPERRLVMPTKNNLAKDSTGLAYSVRTAENGAPMIAWEMEPVTITADEALTPVPSDEEKSGTDWATSILEGLLSKGSMLVSEIKEETKAAGITEKMLRRAREKLGLKTHKSDFKGGWVWSLPGHEDAQEYEEAPFGNEGILGEEGHLRDAIVEVKTDDTE